MLDTDIDDANDVFPVRIGRCVYCDSTDSLSDEHVVPYGLGGTWTLLDASCGDCRDTTSKIERIVLREHFFAVRTVTGMPSRRKASRPSKLPQKLEAAHGKMSVDLELDSHPAPLVFPFFAASPPEGGNDTPLRYRTLRVAPRRGRLEEFAAQTNAEKWTIPCADPETFARFLAKVGYCFAVGSFGLENIREHYVRPLIRTGGPGIARWISSADPPSSVENDGAHHLSAEVENNEIIARIRLFAIPGSPIYSVIVGGV